MDLIERQETIDAIWNTEQHDVKSTVAYNRRLKQLVKIINVVAKLPSAQPEQHWIPCSERLPKRIIHKAIETEQEFFVTVKERWPGEEWTYHTDIAFIPGDYIDEFWQTYNDWYEGQEVHVIAWMPLPEPYAERRTDEAN